MPKCSYCKIKFEPKYFLQKYCLQNDNCIKAFSEYAKEQNIKKQSKESKEKKAKLKKEILTLSDWLKMAQVAFNAFIRERDKNDYCISCKTKISNLWDAGHYRSVGSNPQLRFDEQNVNKQCRKCNGYWGGNPIEYRKVLIEKYGIEVVERIESDNEPKKYTIDDVKKIIEIYRKKIKEIK